MDKLTPEQLTTIRKIYVDRLKNKENEIKENYKNKSLFGKICYNIWGYCYYNYCYYFDYDQYQQIERFKTY